MFNIVFCFVWFVLLLWNINTGVPKVPLLTKKTCLFHNLLNFIKKLVFRLITKGWSHWETRGKMFTKEKGVTFLWEFAMYIEIVRLIWMGRFSIVFMFCMCFFKRKKKNGRLITMLLSSNCLFTWRRCFSVQQIQSAPPTLP